MKQKEIYIRPELQDFALEQSSCCCQSSTNNDKYNIIGGGSWDV